MQVAMMFKADSCSELTDSFGLRTQVPRILHRLSHRFVGLPEWTHLTLCLASYKTFAVVRHVID